MKKHNYHTGNIFLSLSVTVLFALVSYAWVGSASASTAGHSSPQVQYDNDDMVPPMPDVPGAPDPSDIEDPALSPDSAVTEPDVPIEQTEPYIIEPEPDVVNEPVINQDVNVVNEPQPGDAGAAGDNQGTAIQEPDEAVVNGPVPEVNEGSPIINDE